NKIISVSAEHDRGISELLDAIEQQLPSPANIEHPTLVRRRLAEGGSDVEHPIAIAIVGRPNVGKSSLINSIVRGERAIVSELPGTTRDAIDIVYERDGRQFVFIDTAGMRRRGKVSSSAEIHKVQDATRKRIGTGVLNRLIGQALEANPPPLVKGRRLKLFYATQPKNGRLQSAEGSLGRESSSNQRRGNLAPPEFVLFVN